MRQLAALSAVLDVLFAVYLSAVSSLPAADAQQLPAPNLSSTATDLYRDEPLVFEHFDTTVRMHVDGTGERLTRVEVRVQSGGAARQLSLVSVSYASAYETGSIDYVRVHKADGTTVETPASDAIEMPAAVTREAPLYSDLKEKQLPVRSLAAGDTLEYQLHTVRTKAEAPGRFWGAEHFTVTGMVVLSETLTLEVPAATYVKVWSPNHPAASAEHQGLRTWQWRSSQTKPSGRDKEGRMTAASGETHDPDQDADGRNLPSVAWTTFHSWSEVGEWYRGLASDRARPDDAVRKKADELTKEAKSPEEQVRALYQYVSTKTRYVGIDLGIGRYQPHAASDVLATQYGDCKDKDTLLEALLHAKGFTTAPALIGVNITPVPELPSPAVFNHVITTVNLAAGRIWLDATPEVAPFRVLTPVIRDQQALVIPDMGESRLERTPADPPFPYLERFDAVGALDKDGLLKSHMTFNVRSDSELGFRTMVQRAAPSQWDDAMQYVSGAMGFGGKVSNADFRQADLSGPVHLTYDYSRPSFADWDHGRILPLFPLLEVAIIDKEKAPEHDIDQGAPRTLEAHTRIHLPEGYRADLPEAIHVKRSYATFDQTYRLEGGDLIVDRNVVILAKKVSKSDWKDYTAYIKATGVEGGENYISLIAPPAKPGSTQASPKAQSAATGAPAGTEPPKSPQASVQQLLEQAGQSFASGDWQAADDTLEKVRAQDPHAPYLMSMLGFKAMHDRKPDEAIADFKTELREHPDAKIDVALTLSRLYTYQKQYSEAVLLLKSYSSRNDARVSMMLAAVQAKMGSHADAVATLQAAASSHPDDHAVESRLASELLHAHRNTEAIAAAKAAMDGSDDPGILNDNSYILSQLMSDLPLAEKNARRAVELLEASSAKRSLAEANSKAFAEASELTATWDTLGWILFQEDRLKEAEPFIAAAWFNTPNITVGAHLAKVREALGQASEALAIYELATSTENASDSAEELAEVRHSIDRLRKAGTHSAVPGNAGQALQEMRMFRVKKPTGLKGWGTFRVQLGEGGIQESDLVTGPAAMRPVTPELKKLAIPHAVPPMSHARLLRDAVVSCTSEGPDCQFVFMPHAGLREEGVQ